MPGMPQIDPATARERAERATRFLAADPRVKLVYLFGSAADPERKIPVRDVDLAVLMDPPLRLWDFLRFRADVVEAAGGEIDLVPLDKAGVVLAHEVVDAGRCLYANPPELETDFTVRTNLRYLDFKPFLKEQWKIAGERLEERLRGRAS
jgi:predicted nucleotidyltransferase